MNRKIKNPSKLMGIILLLIALCILAITAYRFFRQDTKAPATIEDTLERTNTDSDAEESTPLLNYDFAIHEMPETAYDILEISADRLAMELKDWTYLNGYSQAHSATFYSSMSIDFTKKSYAMQCVLDDPDQTVITMEYLKARDKLTFHL